MKRLRNRSVEKVKYYAVGEYGSRYNRPHYHIIIFNADIETIEQSWGYGSIHYGDVNGASIGYALKYMMKKGAATFEGDDREPEFALMSKGIGKNYLTDSIVEWHMKDLENRMYVTVSGGTKCSMPRYYKDRLFTDVYFESVEVADIKRKVVGLHNLNRMMNMAIKNGQGKDWAIVEHNRVQADLAMQKQLLETVRKNDKM